MNEVQFVGGLLFVWTLVFVWILSNEINKLKERLLKRIEKLEEKAVQKKDE